MTTFPLSALLRLLVAVLLGGLIGFERQIHGRPAGLRTHILVCAGSALIMIASESLGEGSDAGRAVAGIVTGVGFLGAGVIVKSREIVRGLTTAACVWFVAALGILVGQGLLGLAVVSTGGAVCILTVLAWLTQRIPTVNYHTVVVGGRVEQLEELEAQCRREFAKTGLRVVRVASRADKATGKLSLTFYLRTRRAATQADPTAKLLAIADVEDVSWQ